MRKNRRPKILLGCISGSSVNYFCIAVEIFDTRLTNGADNINGLYLLSFEKGLLALELNTKKKHCRFEC